MDGPQSPPRKREQEIDWDRAREELRSQLRAQVACDGAELEDLTQEALVQLLRCIRREGATNLGGLIRVVGRTTAIDAIRRRQRQRARMVQWDPRLDDLSTAPAPGGEEWTDSADLLWFLLLEFFRRRKASCHPLAIAFAEKGNWRAAAESLGLSHDAARQQWSRCAKFFRSELGKNPGPFADWVSADG